MLSKKYLLIEVMCFTGSPARNHWNNERFWRFWFKSFVYWNSSETFVDSWAGGRVYFESMRFITNSSRIKCLSKHSMQCWILWYCVDISKNRKKVVGHRTFGYNVSPYATFPRTGPHHCLSILKHAQKKLGLTSYIIHNAVVLLRTAKLMNHLSIDKYSTKEINFKMLKK